MKLVFAVCRVSDWGMFSADRECNGLMTPRQQWLTMSHSDLFYNYIVFMFYEFISIHTHPSCTVCGVIDVWVFVCTHALTIENGWVGHSDDDNDVRMSAFISKFNATVDELQTNGVCIGHTHPTCHLVVISSARASIIIAAQRTNWMGNVLQSIPHVFVVLLLSTMCEWVDSLFYRTAVNHNATTTPVVFWCDNKGWNMQRMFPSTLSS